MANDELYSGRETNRLPGGVGRGIITDQVIVPTADEIEQQHYRELFNIFFTKLMSWTEIFQEDKYRSEYSSPNNWSGRFEILQTAQGLTISPVNIDKTPISPSEYMSIMNRNPKNYKTPNRVLYAKMGYGYMPPDQDGKYETTMTSMDFTAGLAGGQLFVDLYGKPLQEAHIDVHSFWSGTWDTLTIHTNPPSYPTEQEPRHVIVYTLKAGIFTIKKLHPHVTDVVLMPAAYQLHLFNTLDALITGAQPPTQRPERRATPELGTPRPLPAPRPRTPRG